MLSDRYLIEKFIGKIELIIYGVFFLVMTVLAVIKQVWPELGA